MLFCKNCGAPVGEKDMFCTSCSKRLTAESVINKAGLSSIAAEKSEFTPDAVASTDLTGFCVMDMRLTEKLFSLMGADYYRAVKSNGEPCIPLMMRHIAFPSGTDFDCAALNNGADSSAANALSQQFTEILSRECKAFSAACAAAGVSVLCYRCKVMYSSLFNLYHIFILMDYAQPLPTYFRQNDFSLRNALEVCAELSEQFLKLEKSGFHYGPFSDCSVFFSPSGKVYLDFRAALCYEQFCPLSAFVSYSRQYISPKQKNYEVYSLAVILYRLISGCRHPYINHRGTITAEELSRAERLRSMLSEPYPPDRAQNTLGMMIKNVLSVTPHELTLSEFGRVLRNSLNYMQAGELNQKINFDGTIGL